MTRRYAAQHGEITPINWCGACARRFRGYGTLCPLCSEREARQRERAERKQRFEQMRNNGQPVIDGGRIKT